MANQKTALHKVLVFVLVFLCWFQCSGRVEAAAEHADSKYIWYEDYKYYSGGLNGNLTYQRVTYKSYYTPDEKKLHKLIYKYGNAYYSVFYSFELIDLYTFYTQHYVRTDGSTYDHFDSNQDYTNGNYQGTFLLNNGKRVYYYSFGGVEFNKNTNNQTSVTSYFADYFENLSISNSNVDTALKYILNNGLKPTIPYYGDYTPDWSTSEYHQLLKIENLHASIEDDTLKMTWDPVIYPSGEREFHYIKFNFKQRLPGTVEGGNRRNYVEKQFYIKYKNLCGQVSLSDLELDEGYILSSMTAVPYYHLSDNPEYPLKHGDTSYIYFDDEGNSTNPIIIDPAVDPDVEEEEVPRTILGTIQNFFSNFWRNITNTAKAAVVPESEDLLGLLDEMNTWFSDRFGFIWYPFDLAIDIVAAFGMGEADNKITVPALTLNMFGGVQLWESFEIDLDPVGFLQYVKFFTSVLMCCGTVSLAIRKWDEWIGGKNT